MYLPIVINCPLEHVLRYCKEKLHDNHFWQSKG